MPARSRRPTRATLDDVALAAQVLRFTAITVSTALNDLGPVSHVCHTTTPAGNRTHDGDSS